MIGVVRVLTGVLALIALGTGASGALGGLGEINAPALVDNGHRFFAGVWMGVGLGLFHCAVKIGESTTLLRFLMFAVFTGGLGRLIGALSYVPETRIVVAIAIELFVPVVVVALHWRFAKQGR